MAMLARSSVFRTRWVVPHSTSATFCSSGASDVQAMDEGPAPKTMEKKKKRKKKRKDDGGDDPSDTAAKLTINIKTALRDFRLGDISNASVRGLPTERTLFTVIRGPHVHKKSREQFDVQTRKWRLIFHTGTSKLREKLEFLKEHRIPGVEIKARFQYQTRMAWPLKPTQLADADKWKLLALRDEDPQLYTAAKLAAEFNIEEQQVYDVLRSMEERQKHIEMFGEGEEA